MFKSKPAKTVAGVAVSEPGRAALTYIGTGSEVRGDVRTAGNLRVDGALFGTVHVDGDLEVSADGMIEGERVKARNVFVHGRIKAMVEATEQLRIHGKGRVEGDVTAKSLDIEAGAHFIGYSRTGTEKDAQVLPLERAASGNK